MRAILSCRTVTVFRHIPDGYSPPIEGTDFLFMQNKTSAPRPVESPPAAGPSCSLSHIKRLTLQNDADQSAAALVDDLFNRLL